MSESIHERVPEESPLLWPALFLFVIAVATYVWWWDTHRPVHHEQAAQVPVEAAPASDAAKAPVVAGLGAFTGLKLPDGTSLNVPQLGIESKLVAFIQDASKPVDKTTWFDFDRLLFATGQATLEPSSQEQLHNVAAILKAFPQVHARIGGYTDNVSEADANLRLSQDRANSVMQELITLGVAASRLDAKGYGDQNPVAPNDNEQGRAQNRRISLRVTQK